MEKLTPADWIALIITIGAVVVLVMIAFAVIILGRSFDADLNAIGGPALVVLFCVGVWVLFFKD